MSQKELTKAFGGMIWTEVRIQNPDYDPDSMDWWQSTFEVPVWKSNL